MDELTLDDLIKWHAEQDQAALDRGGADRTTRAHGVKEAMFHGDAVMLLERIRGRGGRDLTAKKMPGNKPFLASGVCCGEAYPVLKPRPPLARETLA
jgi:hypothetical protein